MMTLCPNCMALNEKSYEFCHSCDYDLKYTFEIIEDFEYEKENTKNLKINVDKIPQI